MSCPIPKTVLAIDPGNIDSAFCYLSGDRKIGRFGKVPNNILLQEFQIGTYDYVACEMICSYGMPAGASLFDTCVFIGRILAASRVPVVLLPRLQIKLHLCNSPRANDSTVRQALIDMFGAPGKKSTPGPTFGISADVWSALAVAETYRSGDFIPYQLSHER